MQSLLGTLLYAYAKLHPWLMIRLRIEDDNQTVTGYIQFDPQHQDSKMIILSIEGNALEIICVWHFDESVKDHIDLQDLNQDSFNQKVDAMLTRLYPAFHT